jgi:hypothetical protein
VVGEEERSAGEEVDKHREEEKSWATARFFHERRQDF